MRSNSNLNINICICIFLLISLPILERLTSTVKHNEADFALPVRLTLTMLVR
jgi:hypothetical protein